MLFDIIVKIFQFVDDKDPCDTIRWSSCSKKMYKIWNSLSMDWRLSKRGKWTRFFVQHREDILWELFCNNYVLPWQLYRLGDPNWQKREDLKLNNDKFYKICSIGNPSVEFLEANFDKLDRLGFRNMLSNPKYPLNLVLKYIDTYNPYYHQLFLRKDITVEIWEKYKKSSSLLGYSSLIPLEYYVEHENECSIEELLDNESIPDTFFYENPQFAKVPKWHNYKRSKEFYQRFPELWKGFEGRLDKPLKFWRKQNFNELNLALLIRNRNLPKEFILENITKFNDSQLNEFCEDASLTLEEIEYCNKQLYPRKLNEKILQEENYNLPFGYSKNIMVLAQHEDITIEWIEANITKKEDYDYEFNPWESITSNTFGLTKMEV